MPLMRSKSKKMMEQSDMDSDQPKKQSLAVAYNIQRHEKSKMAHGGHVHNEDCMNDRSMCKYADGGMIDEAKPHSLAEAIRMKHEAKKMADGGMVDIAENSEEEPNDYYSLNEDAAKKELYDDSQLMDQPEDSNEHGHMLDDEDSHDMASQIRKKLRAKRGM